MLLARKFLKFHFTITFDPDAMLSNIFLINFPKSLSYLYFEIALIVRYNTKLANSSSKIWNDTEKIEL